MNAHRERDPMQIATTERRIVELRAQGLNPRRIVAELAAAGNPADLREVHRVLTANANAVRDRYRSLAATRFVKADTILARLIEQLYRDLVAKDPDGTRRFCKDRAKALVAFMDRQAKMLGLDAARGSSGDDSGWLEDKTDAEMVELLRVRYKLDVPADILEPTRD